MVIKEWIYLDGRLLEKFAKDGKLKYLAYLIRAKDLYNNSTIYHYTQKNLAKKLGISQSLAAKLAKYWLDKGYARLHAGNLCLGKIKTDYKNHKTWRFLIKFRTADTVSLINRDLQFHILKLKQKRFDFLRKLRQTIESHPDSKVRKRKQRLADNFGLETEKLPRAMSRLKVSMKGIAKWLGCSVGTAHKLVWSLRNEGLIWLFKQDAKRFYTHNDECLKAFIAENKNSFIHKFVGFKVFCNTYNFTPKMR